MAGGTIFVSGGYDVVHGGHVEFFERARVLGDRLVVCIPSDRVMRAYKGRVTLAGRPKSKGYRSTGLRGRGRHGR